MAKRLPDEVDLPTSRVMESLTVPGRKRLDTLVARGGGGGEFQGWAGEVTMEGVLCLTMSRSAKRFRSQIAYRGGVTYGDDILTIKQELPHNIATAVRGRPVTDVVDHPSLEGLVISSCRIESGCTLLHLKIAPGVRYADIPSECEAGSLTMVDLVDGLRKLGIGGIDRVLTQALGRLNADSRAVFLARLSDAGGGNVRVDDLMPWKEGYLRSVHASRSGNVITCSVSMGDAANYWTGKLTIHSRSGNKYLHSGLFPGFQKTHQNLGLYEHRLGPMLSIDDLEGRLARMAA